MNNLLYCSKENHRPVDGYKFVSGFCPYCKVEKLEADRDRYREALERIVEPPTSPHYDAMYLYHDSVEIANEALRGGEETP